MTNMIFFLPLILLFAPSACKILMDGSVLELSTITSRVDKIRVVDMGIHCLTSESKPGELKELQLVDIARNFPPILTFKVAYLRFLPCVLLGTLTCQGTPFFTNFRIMSCGVGNAQLPHDSTQDSRACAIVFALNVPNQ